MMSLQCSALISVEVVLVGTKPELWGCHEGTQKSDAISKELEFSEIWSGHEGTLRV
jgi:hypothetical protein